MEFRDFNRVEGCDSVHGLLLRRAMHSHTICTRLAWELKVCMLGNYTPPLRCAAKKLKPEIEQPICRVLYDVLITRLNESDSYELFHNEIEFFA